MVENTGVADSFLPFPASMSFVKISPLRSPLLTLQYGFTEHVESQNGQSSRNGHHILALSQGASYFSASNLLRGTPRSSRRAMPKGVPAPGPWDLPGDNVNLDNEGLGEGMHPYIRMGIIVRARRLDLRILMDAHDLHNRGFVDKNTFQRSLAYAFGNQWNELQLTTAEFDEVRTAPQT